MAEATQNTDYPRLLQMIALREEGWQEAFNTIYLRNEDALTSYYVRHTHDAEQAADMAQTLWMSVMEKAAEFARLAETGGDTEGLLRNLARCQVADYYRRKSVQARAGMVVVSDDGAVDGEVENVPDRTPSPFTTLLYEELKRAIERILNGYSDKERLAYHKMSEGFSAEETSKLTGYTVPMVYKKYSQMKAHIRETLQAEGLATLLTAIISCFE